MDVGESTRPAAIRARPQRSSLQGEPACSSTITFPGFLRVYCCALIAVAATGEPTPTNSTSLISSPNPSLIGQPVTLTATVPMGATGQLTFYDGATMLG